MNESFSNTLTTNKANIHLLSSQPRELICIILDLNTNWWIQDHSFKIGLFLDSIIAFSKMYISMSSQKELAILAVTGDCSEFIYNTEMVPTRKELQELGHSITFTQNFSLKFLEYKVRNNILNMFSNCSSFSTNVNMSGGFIKALCYYKRRLNYRISEQAQTDFCGRFLVIRTTAQTNNACFMAMMNGVFSAQKLNICVDVCVLHLPVEKPRHRDITNENGNNDAQIAKDAERTSNIWRQAADMTGGIYLFVDKQTELLQYLITLFLCDKVTRQSVMTTVSTTVCSSFMANSPENSSNGPENNNSADYLDDSIDFRACCFCHGRLINVGFVCSLCLAVFCEYATACRCCKALYQSKQINIANFNYAKKILN